MEKTCCKLCSKCRRAECERDFRFCSACRSIVEKAMNNSNYLTHVPSHNSYRGPGARENVGDTRRGHR
jgi:hypothetical protein